jgi:hypothetical protein
MRFQPPAGTFARSCQRPGAGKPQGRPAVRSAPLGPQVAQQPVERLLVGVVLLCSPPREGRPFSSAGLGLQQLVSAIERLKVADILAPDEAGASLRDVHVGRVLTLGMFLNEVEAGLFSSVTWVGHK